MFSILENNKFYFPSFKLQKNLFFLMHVNPNNNKYCHNISMPYPGYIKWSF